MTQDENFVGEGFAVFSAKRLRSPHFLFSAVVNSDEINRNVAALLGGESFEVFSAKLKREAKKPAMQDCLTAAICYKCRSR